MAPDTGWMEAIATGAPWLVPLLALAGLWVARCSEEQAVRCWAERIFFSLLLLAAGGTIRTVAVADPCWFLHTASLSAMIIGAVVPSASAPSVEGF